MRKLIFTRLQLCILFLTLLYISSFAQEQKANLKINKRFIGKTNIDILNELASDADLSLEYNEEDIKKEFISGIIFKDEPLNEAIQKLLNGQEVHFQITSSKIIIKPLNEEFTRETKPEMFDFNLNGKLIDKETGETLPFANIGVNSNGKGTTTNSGGYFTLLNVPSDTSSITIQHIGYQTKHTRLTPGIAKQKIVIFELEPSSRLLDEVVVMEKKESIMKVSEKVGVVSVSPAQLSTLPTIGEKDIFRALQWLPGISATNETSSGLYVRGGTPDQNLVLLDGFTVYHVDHFYGFFSAFNSNAIKDVRIYKGGFESKFGGRLSSVVELTGKTGNTNKVSGNAGFSALSANASLEVPFAQGAGTFLFAARRSYTDIIKSGIYKDVFSLFNEDEETSQGNFSPGSGGFGGFGQRSVDPAFYFYDISGKISYRLSSVDIISLSFYTGQDNLDESSDLNSNSFTGGFGGFPGTGNSGNSSQFSSSNTDLTKWGNKGTSLQWGRQWNNRFYSNTIVAYSNYYSDRDAFSETEVNRDDSTFTSRSGSIEENNLRDFTVRMDNEYLMNEKNKIEFGTQFTYNKIDYSYLWNDTLQLQNRHDKGYVMAVYLQDTWNPVEGLTVNPGLRVSYYDITDKLYPEPRLSGSYQLTDHIKLKAAWGIYYQFVSRIVREDLSQGSRDFWLLTNDKQNPVSSAYHYIAGISYELDSYLFDVEAYYKDMQGLTEYSLRFSNMIGRTGSSELFFKGTGYSRGIDFLLQKKYGKYTGWIGYTIGEVIYDFPEISDEPYHATHDQTHEFKFVNSLKLGRWTISGTWVYATGKPYTAPIGRYSLTLLDGSEYSYISVGKKNAYRLPDYHRMDVSITYGFKIGKAGDADLGLSVFNLYNRQNIWYKKFEVIDDNLIVTDVNTIGFTPNISFNVKF